MTLSGQSWATPFNFRITSLFSMLSTGFTRFAAEVWKVHAQCIHGLEWFCTDKNGKGILTTTGDGSAPTPPDYLLMGLGACAGNGIKFVLEKKGKKVNSISVDVEGEWTSTPTRRMKEIRMNVKCDAGISTSELEKIVEDVKHKMCPVAGTLLHTPEIKTTVQTA